MERLCKIAVGVYIIVLILGAPYWPFASAADDAPREYVDRQYHFAFQYPANWKVEKHFPALEAGEVRLIIRHPSKPMRVAAVIGHLKRGLTKQEFASSPNREAVVEAMIAFTLERVYKTTLQNMGADKMTVSEKRALPSEVGIKYYISTAHINTSVPTLIAGTHMVPFGKPYMVTCMIVTPVDETATQDNETITRVFRSFHLLGERPMK
jgi:hypothetical protein